MTKNKKLFAVVPAYNEEKLVGATVRGSRRHVSGVIVVDDRSEDNTYKVAKKTGAIVIRHKKNKGVGGAIKTGYREAMRRGADVMIVLAGDNQMDPREIHKVVRPIIEGKADFVKGNRFRKHDPKKKGMPLHRVFGSWALTALTMIFTGYRISDPACGYVAISKETVRKLPWKLIHDRYAFEVSVLMNLSIKKMKVVEVDVRPRYGRAVSTLKLRLFIPSVLGVYLRGLLWKLGYRKLKRI